MSHFTPSVPHNVEQRNIVDKLAQFVARNGPEFESMTKEKQRDNPKFAFLYGGEFSDYYLHKVEEERNSMQQKYPGGNPFQWAGNRSMDRQYSRSSNWDEQYYENSNYWNRYGPQNANGPRLWQSPGPWSQPCPPTPWNPYNSSQNTPFNYPYSKGYPLNIQTSNRMSPYTNNMSDYSLQTSFPSNTLSIPPAANTHLSIQDIKDSEENLNAQHKDIMQQKDDMICDCLDQSRDEAVRLEANSLSINYIEMNNVIQPLIESCTKENIAKGKNWVIEQMSANEKLTNLMGQYLLARVANSKSSFDLRLHIVYLLNDLLHHFKRRGVVAHLKETINKIVMPIYCLSMEKADEEKQLKLSRVLDLWDSNAYLPPDVLKNMRSPQCITYMQEWRNEQTKLFEFKITEIERKHNDRFEQLRKQHEEFTKHVHQVINEQELAATAVHEEELRSPIISDMEPRELVSGGESEDGQLSRHRHPPFAVDDHGVDLQSSVGHAPLLEPVMYPPWRQNPGNDHNTFFQHDHHERYSEGSAGYGIPDFMDDSLSHMHHREDENWNFPPSNFPVHHPRNMHMERQNIPYRDADNVGDGHYDMQNMHRPSNSRGRRGFDIPHNHDNDYYENFGPQNMSSFPPYRYSEGDQDYNDWNPRKGRRFGPPPSRLISPPRSQESSTPPAVIPSEPSVPQDLIPKAAHWQLPAALMYPLIGVKDFEFKPIDPNKLRLLPVESPSESLMRSIDAFYAPATNDHPRDAEGWERLGLYEYYRAKEEVKKLVSVEKIEKPSKEHARKRTESGGSEAVSEVISESDQVNISTEVETNNDIESDNLPFYQTVQRNRLSEKKASSHLAYLSAYPPTAIGQPIRTGPAALIGVLPSIYPLQGTFNMMKTSNDNSVILPPNLFTAPPVFGNVPSKDSTPAPASSANGSLIPPHCLPQVKGPPSGFMNFPPPGLASSMPVPPTQMITRNASFGSRRLENRRRSRSRSYSRSRSRSASSHSRDSRSQSRSQSRSRSRSHSDGDRERSRSRSRSSSRSPHDSHSSRSRSSTSGNNGSITTAGFLRRDQKNASSKYSKKQRDELPWINYNHGRSEPMQMRMPFDSFQHNRGMPPNRIYGGFQNYGSGGYRGGGYRGGLVPPMRPRMGPNQSMPYYSYDSDETGRGRKSGRGYHRGCR